MDTMAAYAMAQASQGKELMVFDWNKAAQIIKDWGASKASAGLEADFEWTGGVIFEHGKPETEEYTYLASVWAKPQLYIDGEFIPCFLMQSDCPGQGAYTKWPEFAIKILEGK